MLDTQTFTIHEDELGENPNSYNGWSEKYAQIAVLKALEKSDIENIKSLKFTSYTCKMIDPKKSYSEVCYLETEHHGYYFVMRDMVDHINVVYNRWD